MSVYWFNPLLQGTDLLHTTGVEVTGIECASGVGFAFVGHVVSGLTSASHVGTVTVRTQAFVQVSGLESTSQVGGIGGAEIAVSGFESIGLVGELDTSIGISVSIEVTGINATAYLNPVRSWSDIPNSPPTQWIEIS